MISSSSLVRDALRKLNRGGTMRAHGLAGRVAKVTKLPTADVLLAFGELRRSNELSATDWYPNHEPIGQVSLAMEVQVSPEEIRWQAALDGAGIKPEDSRALLSMAGILKDVSLFDLQRLAKGLLVMREAQRINSGRSRYHVSAQYLLSSSKLLDMLPAVALRKFGIDPAVFEAPPGYVIVAGPPQPKCVVLVENPQALELALEAEGVDDVAWVATFGYGLSGVGDEYGNQLATFFEGGRKRLHALTRKGNPPALADLLSHPCLYFWGDLDHEGIWIFKRIQKVIPQLKLSAIYVPMILRLQHGEWHPYVYVTGKQGQKPRIVQDKTSSQLLGLCASGAIDQESVTAQDIAQYARLPLDQMLPLSF